jgi:hypothetical protein
MSGGNSHQRKMARRAEERIAEQVAQRVAQQIEAKSATSAVPPSDEEWSARSLREKMVSFWGSTPIWGAIGVLIGEMVSQLSIRLLFFAVWAVVFVEFVRVGFFERRLFKALGNIAVGLTLALVFFQLWKLSPKPKEPPTVDQYVEAFARKFPWLSNPPQSTPSQVAMRAPINPCAGKGVLSAFKNICDGQVGQWAIDEAIKVGGMADEAMRGNDSFSAFQFANAFSDCCVQDLKDLRQEMFGRLGPPSKGADDIGAWNLMFLSEKYPAASNAITPTIVKSYIPHFRLLGLRLKRKEIPRSPSVALKFSEVKIVPEEALRLPVAGVGMLDQFSGAPHERFPYGINVTITPKATISTGYVVVEFDVRYAAVSCDAVDFVLVDDTQFIENSDVVDILKTHSGMSYIVQVGKTPLAVNTTLHVEAYSNSLIRVTKVTYFDE